MAIGRRCSIACTSPLLIHLFSSDPKVQEVLQWYMLVMPLGYGLQGVVILANSSFNALHKPSRAVLLSVCRFFLFYVPLAYAGGLVFGVKGLFFGAVTGNVCIAVIAWVAINRSMKRLHQSIHQSLQSLCE